ncbi:hypothetical protein P9139_17145 [Curtobacterium flaccumfaciens]|nr:hypothetical protein P9139_17145 [Curtobacterium flaccumfaciens]
MPRPETPRCVRSSTRRATRTPVGRSWSSSSLGHDDRALLRSALRSWVAFVEEMLDEVQPRDEGSAADLTALLVRSAVAIVAALDATG